MRRRIPHQEKTPGEKGEWKGPRRMHTRTRERRGEREGGITSLGHSKKVYGPICWLPVDLGPVRRGPLDAPLSFRFAIFRPLPHPPPERGRAQNYSDAMMMKREDRRRGRGKEMEALSFSRFGIEEADKKRSELLARLLCLGRAPGIPVRSSIAEKNGYS